MPPLRRGKETFKGTRPYTWRLNHAVLERKSGIYAGGFEYQEVARHDPFEHVWSESWIIWQQSPAARTTIESGLGGSIGRPVEPERVIQLFTYAFGIIVARGVDIASRIGQISF